MLWIWFHRRVTNSGLENRWRKINAVTQPLWSIRRLALYHLWPISQIHTHIQIHRHDRSNGIKRKNVWLLMCGSLVQLGAADLKCGLSVLSFWYGLDVWFSADMCVFALSPVRWKETLQALHQVYCHWLLTDFPFVHTLRQPLPLSSLSGLLCWLITGARLK